MEANWRRWERQSSRATQEEIFLDIGSYQQSQDGHINLFIISDAELLEQE